MTRRQELSADEYILSNEFSEGETDFIIYFGPINPAYTDWMRPGFELQSLDNQLNPKRKFYEEGISYTAPKLKPRTIPAFTYDLPGNGEPLLTVEVDRRWTQRTAAVPAQEGMTSLASRPMLVTTHWPGRHNEQNPLLPLPAPLPGARA